MFRVLLRLLRPLHSIAKSLERIAAAQERLSPPPGAGPEATVFTTSPESLAYEDRRRAEWEAGHGKLRPGDLPPDDFAARSDEKTLKEFLG
jgi:hypothetical protein